MLWVTGGVSVIVLRKLLLVSVVVFLNINRKEIGMLKNKNIRIFCHYYHLLCVTDGGVSVTVLCQMLLVSSFI